MALAVVVGVLAFHAGGRVDRVAASSDVSWPVFDGDSSRTGINPAEVTIGRDNVGQLVLRWTHSLAEAPDSSPVYQSGRVFFDGPFGHTYAVDLQTGQGIWSGSTHGGPMWTTSSPALDPSGQWLYSYELDGAIHRHSTADGHEGVGNGWPVVLTYHPDVEKGSSALNIANGRLYATTASFEDTGHYDGHLLTADLSNGSTTVFNTLCSDIPVLLTDQAGQTNYCSQVGTGLWGRSGVVIEPDTGNIFITTGNGDWNGVTDWGDSVLELSPDAQTVLDSYTPTNQQDLNNADLDLGSAMPALLPLQSTSNTPYLAVQIGKDGILRLLNRRDLSGGGKPGLLGGELQTVPVVNKCGVFTTPIAWTDEQQLTWLYVATSCGLEGYQVLTDSVGVTTLTRAWQIPTSGSSPILANGVLYDAHTGGIDARDSSTGNLLWSSTSTGASIGYIHWASPIIVDGMLIIVDWNGQVAAFGLQPPTPTVTPTSTQTSARTVTPTPTVSATSTPADTATDTPMVSATTTSTSTATSTQTETPTASPIPVSSGTPPATPTFTAIPSITATSTEISTPVHQSYFPVIVQSGEGGW